MQCWGAIWYGTGGLRCSPCFWWEDHSRPLEAKHHHFSSDHRITSDPFERAKASGYLKLLWFSVLTVLWTLRIMICKNRNHCEGAIPLAVRDGDGEVGLSSTCFIPVALLLSLPGRGRPYWLVSAATFGVFFETGKGSWTELRRRVRACGYAMLRQ